MKAPEPMNCSAKAPKCACYKALEKNAETFEFENEFVVVSVLIKQHRPISREYSHDILITKEDAKKSDGKLIKEYIDGEAEYSTSSDWDVPEYWIDNHNALAQVKSRRHMMAETFESENEVAKTILNNLIKNVWNEFSMVSPNGLEGWLNASVREGEGSYYKEGMEVPSRSNLGWEEIDEKMGNYSYWGDDEAYEMVEKYQDKLRMKYRNPSIKLQLSNKYRNPRTQMTYYSNIKYPMFMKISIGKDTVEKNAETFEANSDEDNCPVCNEEVYGDMSMIGEEIVPDICGDCDIYVMPQGSDFKVRCIECGYGDFYGSRTPCESCEPIADKMEAVNNGKSAETFEADKDYEWEWDRTDNAPTELIKKRLKEAGFKLNSSDKAYGNIIVEFYEPKLVAKNGNLLDVTLSQNEEFDGFSRLTFYDNNDENTTGHAPPMDWDILYEKGLLKGEDSVENPQGDYYEVYWDGLYDEWKDSQKESHNCSDNADLEIYEDDFIVMECNICGRNATFRQETPFYGTRNAETFEAEEGDDCPSCANACKHDDSNKIKVESIYDYEIQSPSNMVIQVTCLDCGESGTFYADEVDWHGEEAKLKYSPQIAVNMMNPTYGDLRCSRCNDRFQMAVENHAETYEAAVIRQGKAPKGAMAKAMMNQSMMEQANIEAMIQELENKVNLGLISEDDLMASLKKKFGAEYDIEVYSSEEFSKEDLEAYFADLKKDNPKLAKIIEFKVKNEEYLPKQLIESSGYDYEILEAWNDYVIDDDKYALFDPCPACEGEGWIMTSYTPATRFEPADGDGEDCEECGGSGKIDPSDYMYYDDKGEIEYAADGRRWD